METLIDDYKRRLATIEKEIDKFEHNCPNKSDYTRLKTKASCYKQFIVELERELKAK